MTTIGEAFNIANFKHRGQKDKSGEPYILHCVRVAQTFEKPWEIAVALLHDVVEDTDLELSDLEPIFPNYIVTAIDAMTKREGEPYEDYLARVKANPIALKVKIADIRDNSDPRRLVKLPPDEVERLGRKYVRAMSYLTSSQGE